MSFNSTITITTLSIAPLSECAGCVEDCWCIEIGIAWIADGSVDCRFVVSFFMYKTLLDFGRFLWVLIVRRVRVRNV